MRIYLDVCAWNRLLDVQTQTRIRLETEAVISILELREEKEVSVVISEMVLREIHNTKDSRRREMLLDFLKLAGECIMIDEVVIERAADLLSRGIQKEDAFHLALAQKGAVEYFITTDDRIIKKASQIKCSFTISNPIDYIRSRLL